MESPTIKNPLLPEVSDALAHQFSFFDSQILIHDDPDQQEQMIKLREKVHTQLKSQSEIEEMTDDELTLYLCLFVPVLQIGLSSSSVYNIKSATFEPQHRLMIGTKAHKLKNQASLSQTI